MAKVVEIAELRLAIGEEKDENPYTDRFLNDVIDGEGGVNAAAARIWGHKAASAAGLVDVTEGGSSRKLGDLYKNALAMQKTYENRAAADAGQPTVPASYASTRPIARPRP